MSDAFIVNIKFCFFNDEPDVLLELIDGQQVELQMLHTTTNCFRNFLRISRGQHKHNLRWWLFECLQQSSFCRTREHVDFVENENPMATRARQRSCLDDVANLLDTVIAGCVQFKDVVTGA